MPGSEGGIETITLQVNPELSLTYASLGNRIMVSTDPDGVRQVAQAESTLLGADAFAPGHARSPATGHLDSLSRPSPALEP